MIFTRDISLALKRLKASIICLTYARISTGVAGSIHV